MEDVPDIDEARKLTQELRDLVNQLRADEQRKQKLREERRAKRRDYMKRYMRTWRAKQYDHDFQTINGSTIFRLVDEGKMAVIFKDEAGHLTLCRTSDLWQRSTCTQCIAAARKAKREAKASEAKAKREAQKAKTQAIKDKANARKRPAKQEASPTPPVGVLNRMTKANLIKEAKQRGIKVDPKATKTVIVGQILKG